jgi:hypothetical protein
LRERSGALESARDALEQERTLSAERLRSAEARAAGPKQMPPAPKPAADSIDEPAREEPRRRDRRLERDLAYERAEERGHDIRPRPAAPHRVDRPVNPALQPRPNWVWRVLALLVIVAVAVAVWVVLHSTILH